MHGNKIKCITLTTLLLSLLIIPNNLSFAYENKVKVVTTLPYLVSIIESIGNDLIEVECLIPQGADPHHYELTINDMQKVENADLIVTTGPSHLPVESKILEMVSKGEIKSTIINYKDYVRNGLNLLKLPNGRYNPHGYFLSCNGTKAIAISVADALKKIDPKNSKLYEYNLLLYLNNIDKIIKMAKSSLDGKEIKVALLTPILQYALNDLGIKIISILVPEHGVEPTAKAIEDVISLAKKREIDFILLTDRDESEYRSVVKIFNDENIPYIIVPFLKNKIAKRPELISIIVSSSIFSYIQPKTQDIKKFNLTLPLTASIATNIILSILVILLYIKIRRLE